jgi:hypothetical protein
MVIGNLIKRDVDRSLAIGTFKCNVRTLRSVVREALPVVQGCDRLHRLHSRTGGGALMAPVMHGLPENVRMT